MYRVAKQDGKAWKGWGGRTVVSRSIAVFALDTYMYNCIYIFLKVAYNTGNTI